MLPSSLTLNLMPPPVSWPTHPTLLPAETCYSTFDRELLGVYLSIIQFHHFLEGRLLTDHKPLTYALNVRSDRHSPRQARHLDYIAQFTQWYRQCSCWRPVSNWNERPPLWPTSHWPTNPCTPILTILNSRGRTSRPTGLNRPSLLRYFHWHPKTPGSATMATNCVQLPHGLSHPGIRATQKLITARFVWPGINSDVRRWTRSCVQCQRAKIQRHTTAPLTPFPTPDNRFDVIHIDWLDHSRHPMDTHTS